MARTSIERNITRLYKEVNISRKEKMLEGFHFKQIVGFENLPLSGSGAASAFSGLGSEVMDTNEEDTNF
jgi:hypothetical protein